MAIGSPLDLQFGNSDAGAAVDSVANVPSVMAEWTVPRTDRWVIRDKAVMQLKLHDAADAELPKNTDVILAVKKPLDTVGAQIKSKKYGPWATESLANQLSALYQQNFQLRFAAGGVTLPPGSKLQLLALGSVVADKDNSDFTLPVERFPA